MNLHVDRNRHGGSGDDDRCVAPVPRRVLEVLRLLVVTCRTAVEVVRDAESVTKCCCCARLLRRRTRNEHTLASEARGESTLAEPLSFVLALCLCFWIGLAMLVVLSGPLAFAKLNQPPEGKRSFDVSEALALLQAAALEVAVAFSLGTQHAIGLVMFAPV